MSEWYKREIRARMRDTGEPYGVARKAWMLARWMALTAANEDDARDALDNIGWDWERFWALLRDRAPG